MSVQVPQNAERYQAREFSRAGRLQQAERSARVLRFFPAALAAYESRYLIAHFGSLATVLKVSGSGTAALCGLLLLAALSGVFLREGGRGLGARVPRPGWSLGLLGSWLLCSAMLGVLLIAPAMLHAWSALGPAQPLVHSVVAGGWSAVPAVLMVGLVLAATLQGVRWLLQELVDLRPSARNARSSAVATCGAAVALRPSATPLRAGWSDRGPPAAALAAF